MNFASEDDYGWRLRDCKKQLPVICETFVCYNDGKNAQYRCRDNSACIPRSALCDHIQDCGDNDDELSPNCDCSCNSGQPKMLTDSYGSIYSPGYATSGKCAPSPGQQCEWQIHQPPGTRLKLNLMSVNLEHGDRLVVEGLDSGEKFSASPGGPTVVVMSGSKLRIRYTPQAGGKPSRGFHLQYTSDDSSTCVRRFESWNGTFSPPTRIPDTSRYRPSTDCMWTIANDEKKLLTVNVPLFELARGDWLIVYDGPPARANVLGNFSRDNPPPRSFVSAEAELNFKFWTQPGTPGDKGFQIMFERTCLNERLEYDYGTIESLGYRNPSRRKPFHCSWIIEPPCAKDAAEPCSLTVFFDNLNLTNKDLIVVESGGDFVTFDGSSLPQGAFRTEQSPTIVHMYGRSAQFAASISYSIDCKEPVLTASNTMTLLSDDQPYAYRAEVEFGCLGDFSNGGTRRAACKAGGQWSIAPPMCVMKSCVVPPLKHGDVKKLDRKKQELTWACNFAYRPEKETVSTCTDGGWDPVPQCQEIKCDSDSPDHWPKQITGDSKLSAYRTRVTFGNRVYSRAYYECSKGELRGPQSYLYCQPDGKWSDAYFYCQMLGCLANNVKFGNFSSVWTPLDGQNPIKCINGYEFSTNGAGTVPTCKNNFVWSIGSDGGNPIACTAKDHCTPNPCGTSGTCQDLNGGYTCSCATGYRFEPTEAVGQSMQALAATTTNSDAPVIVSDTLFLTSTTATAYCPRWPISRVVECTLNAVWNETLDTFTCPQEKCDASMLKLDAATVIVNRIKSDYGLGQTIHFECDSSFPYILVGPSSLICEYDPTDPKHPLKHITCDMYDHDCSDDAAFDVSLYAFSKHDPGTSYQ
ncbi:Fibropellin-1 [Aphelenchoides avenae]|nr:Fibropellin-1 [Aphelenchus avenae]